MALTMVHLLAADRWAATHEQYVDSPEFFLGAISPDAIHVRDHDDKSHKDEIHLHNWQAPHPDEVAAYWRERRAPFDVGYGVHVLTDGQWVPRYKSRLPGLFLPNGRLDVNRYYDDTFATDFKLYRENPRLESILRMIGRAETPSDHPLLTKAEFDDWRDMILKAYRGECPRHASVRYIDADYVLAFVTDSTALIDRVYAEAGFVN